jgi:hypothetical protein
MPNVPFRDLTCVDFFVVTANERSLILPSLCAGAPASRASPRLTGKPAASLCKRRSASAHSPSLPLGIETANQGGSQERKAMPCPINPTHASSRQDVYAEITSQLIAAIEADPGKPELPWRKSSGALFMPVNALTQNAYNGINIVSLWVAAETKGFASPLWATYRQWFELGAQVRAGEKSSPSSSSRNSRPSPIPEMQTMTASAASPAPRAYSTQPRWTVTPSPPSPIRSVPSNASQQPTFS